MTTLSNSTHSPDLRGFIAYLDRINMADFIPGYRNS
jgi:hypothetical protein